MDNTVYAKDDRETGTGRIMTTQELLIPVEFEDEPDFQKLIDDDMTLDQLAEVRYFLNNLFKNGGNTEYIDLEETGRCFQELYNNNKLKPFVVHQLGLIRDDKYYEVKTYFPAVLNFILTLLEDNSKINLIGLLIFVKHLFQHLNLKGVNIDFALVDGLIQYLSNPSTSITLTKKTKNGVESRKINTSESLKRNLFNASQITQFFKQLKGNLHTLPKTNMLGIKALIENLAEPSEES